MNVNQEPEKPQKQKVEKKRKNKWNFSAKKMASGMIKHSRLCQVDRKTIATVYRYLKRNHMDDGFWKKAVSIAQEKPDIYQVFTNANSRTVFTSARRLSILDLDDERVREGQRICYEALRLMQQRADHAGIRFVVLLIPKEYVFNKAATTCEHPDYLALVQHEKVFWEETRRSLAQENIEYIEALPALQAQLEKGPQPYQVHADGHPSRHGHRAIAQAVFDYLQEKNGN